MDECCIATVMDFLFSSFLFFTSPILVHIFWVEFEMRVSLIGIFVFVLSRFSYQHDV